MEKYRKQYVQQYQKLTPLLAGKILVSHAISRRILKDYSIIITFYNHLKQDQELGQDT
jgi:hypothetical protein